MSHQRQTASIHRQRGLLVVLTALVLMLGSLASLQHDATHIYGDPTCTVCLSAHPAKATPPSLPTLEPVPVTDESPQSTVLTVILRSEHGRPSARAPPVLS